MSAHRQVAMTYTVDGVVMSPLEYIDYLHGQVAAQAGHVAVPEGWKPVPVEPTNEMVNAYEVTSPAPFFADAYRAMLAAAPSPLLVKESK